jgi:hypothetical protein
MLQTWWSAGSKGRTIILLVSHIISFSFEFILQLLGFHSMRKHARIPCSKYIHYKIHLQVTALVASQEVVPHAFELFLHVSSWNLFANDAKSLDLKEWKIDGFSNFGSWNGIRLLKPGALEAASEAGCSVTVLHLTHLREIWTPNGGEILEFFKGNKLPDMFQRMRTNINYYTVIQNAYWADRMERRTQGKRERSV